MLTLLWIAFTDFSYILPQINYHHQHRVVIAAWELWKWKQLILEKTLAVCCCVTVFTLVLNGGLAIQYTIPAIRIQRRETNNLQQALQSNVKPLTTAVNTQFTADAKNSFLNPVSTPSSAKWITSGSIAKVIGLLVISVFKIPLHFPFFYTREDAMLHLIWHHMIAGHCALRFSSMACKTLNVHMNLSLNGSLSTWGSNKDQWNNRKKLHLMEIIQIPKDIALSVHINLRWKQKRILMSKVPVSVPQHGVSNTSLFLSLTP